MRLFRKNKRGEKPIARERTGYYERRIRRWRNRVGLLILMLTLVFWGQLLLRSTYFSVKGVHALGMQSIEQAHMQDRIARYLRGRRWLIFPRDNVFTLRSADLAFFLEKDPRIATATVDVDYGSRMIHVAIEERTPTYILDAHAGVFAIDQYGDVLSERNPPTPETPVHIADTRPRRIVLGDAAFQDDFFERITAVEERLFTYTPIAHVARGTPSHDAFTVTTAEGWSIYFSDDAAVEPQLIRLETLLKGTLAGDARSDLSYIDLRFGDRVFYK